MTKRRHLAQTAALVGGVLLAVSVWVVVEYFVIIECFDGDGGAPYTAHDSPRGALCRAADGAVVRALPILCLALGILLGAAIVRRWRDRRLPAAALAVVVLAPALITVGIPAFVAATVSSHCSDDQQAAIDRWRQEGAIGSAPYDCEHY
ncbi:MAG: hypothetical protein IPK24_11780 [Kineosporiaceae bacterium]|nr:hypothetical protein [Kineosporiaceae bacterium]MBK8076215.1 hypothetical protein [Kineosporiaceae bacterium]